MLHQRGWIKKKSPVIPPIEFFAATQNSLSTSTLENSVQDVDKQDFNDLNKTAKAPEIKPSPNDSLAPLESPEADITPPSEPQEAASENQPTLDHSPFEANETPSSIGTNGTNTVNDANDTKSVNGARKRRRFSVQDELEQMKAEEERFAKAKSMDGPQSEFSEEQLAKAWDMALEYLLTHHHINLHSALNEEGYQLNGTVLATTVHSQAQKKELDEIATGFTEIIRGAVNNYALTLDIHVSEMDEEKYDSFAVDPTEKFSLMAAKNPALLKLKDALDLRF